MDLLVAKSGFLGKPKTYLDIDRSTIQLCLARKKTSIGDTYSRGENNAI